MYENFLPRTIIYHPIWSHWYLDMINNSNNNRDCEEVRENQVFKVDIITIPINDLSARVSDLASSRFEFHPSSVSFDLFLHVYLSLLFSVSIFLSINSILCFYFLVYHFYFYFPVSNFNSLSILFSICIIVQASKID